MDEIRIHDLVLECIVGILPHERVATQSLIVNATLLLDTHQAAQTGRIGRTVHYAEVAEQIATLLRFRRYRLLEVAATELVAMLLGVHPRLERVRLEIRKPGALTGIAAGASLTIERDRTLLQRATAEAKALMADGQVFPPGAVHLWHSTEASLSMHALAPGEALSVYALARAPTLSVGSSRGYAVASAAVSSAAEATTPALRALVWVLAGQVEVGGKAVRAGQHMHEDVATATKWKSSSAQNARIFCCTTWCEHNLT